MPTQGSSATSAIDPWAVQSRIGLTDGRMAINSLLMPRPNLTYIDYRSGVMASGDSRAENVKGTSTHMGLLVSPGDGMNVTVEMGHAVINTPGQGAYMCPLDSQKTLPIAAASATSNRIDLVVARVYDDLNPAIGSAPEVRKFQVEVWTGDPATGDPVEPTPTASAGWIPLAAVYVAKSAKSLTDANITDRRGPGLVARGGMRALYADDALAGSSAFDESGAYPGEQRWVHNRGFQHQVYYGGNPDATRGGWRGVNNCMLYTASPPKGETVWVRGTATTRELCRVKIPYPGVPYMVYPTARAFLMLSPLTSVDVRITANRVDDNAVNWMRISNEWRNEDQRMVPNVAPMLYGPLTDDVEIILSGSVRDTPSPNHGFSFRGNDSGQTFMTVNVYPSVVQPVEV